MAVVPDQVHFLTPRRVYPEAPLFVFTPGMDGTGQLLRAQTEGLEQAFDVRCLAIPPDDLTSWHDLTEQVVTLVRTELEGNCDRKVYLCGESFGGCLAMKMMVRSPQLFHRLILVNPASSFNRRPWIHWGSQLTQFLPEPLYQTSCIGLLPFLASLGRIGASDRQALLEAMQSVTQKSSIWRMSLLREFRLSDDELASIKQPVLLVASLGDRLLPSVNEAHLLAQSLPNAKIHILPNSGHACLLESDINLYNILRSHRFLDLQVEQQVDDSSPITLSGSRG
ncbi:alpha/beta hydrolase [Oscillatoria sp. FACHB-1407]|uniref:alpha/beta fold hydrolase n=1 Tax=Oscillatoria sp. FACHB-1407 TaxID=2692847 RepID=UPI001682C963|nr:alpha/beta hydrolase [Oscillatoria sp. FACHB-1407]MBD2463326.1 alpha/beta hydrolase [Oscillatoria sp. FACHB-1407]